MTSWLAPLALASILSLKVLCGSATATEPDVQRPIRSIYVAIAEGAQPEFLEQLQRFADANIFTMRVADTGPRGSHILVEMRREDLKVLALNPFELREFRISFYANARDPTAGDSTTVLVSDLKERLNSVRGLRLIEGWR